MPPTEVTGSAVTDALFAPLQVGTLTLSNRLVMAPMGTCLDNDGHITDDTIAYYRRRAAGGVGTICVEGCLVSADTVGPEPRISDRKYVAGLARLVATLREFPELTVGVQLMHPGRQVVDGPSVAPSPIPLNSHAATPHELTAAEIMRIVADYAEAAKLAQEAGFDFVEVHGAHGYLPSNFLSGRDNLRTDRYGGSIENRARFSIEVAGAIIDALGPETPLFWRMNAEDGIPGGFGPEEATQVARLLEAAGVAALSISAGTWHTLEVTLAPMFIPRGHMLDWAAQIKSAVSIPVIAVGRLDDPLLAADALHSGKADLVCLGRGLIADPDWPLKVQRGAIQDVRPCIACNACVDLVGRGERARCSVNPEVGRELTWSVTPATRPRRIMVVGSGPAGMEAARVAALRGHQVSIWDDGKRLGGKLEVAASAPSKTQVLEFRDYECRILVELGVDIHVGTTVTAELVDAMNPDVVVVATGAEPLLPPIPGIGSAHVYDAQAILRRDVKPRGCDSVVVVGGSATGCEAAEFLLGDVKSISIIEMATQVGAGIEPITRRHLLRHLASSGVQILTKSKVIMIGDDHVIYEDTAGGTHEIPADVVALALGWRPTGSEMTSQFSGKETVVLGDASSPADFVHAVNAGADAGLLV